MAKTEGPEEITVEYLKESLAPERLPDDAPISEVLPIHWVPRVQFKKADEIARYVEQPLVAACTTLFEKNITTTLTSANQDGLLYRRGALFIDYNTLSEENQAIAQEMGKIRVEGDIAVCVISIPLDEASTIEGVSEYALGIAERFQSQT